MNQELSDLIGRLMLYSTQPGPAEQRSAMAKAAEQLSKALPSAVAAPSECELPECQHRVCVCGHAECGHADENVQPNCSDCDCSRFKAAQSEMTACEVYCHECSKAGGGDAPIYHTAPACGGTPADAARSETPRQVLPIRIEQADVDAFTRVLRAKGTPWAGGCADVLEQLWQDFNNERIQREAAEQSRDSFKKCWEESESARSSIAATGASRIADQIELQFLAPLPPDDYQSEWSFGVKLDFRDWRAVVKALRSATTDTTRLDWLEKHPRIVGYAEGYHGSKGSWTWRDQHRNVQVAESLRDAIDRAVADSGGKAT